MTENAILIEPSFADAIAVIARAAELPEDKRRHWTTSLRQIAKLLDKALELIPARYSAVRAALLHLHHASGGLTAKTLQNHKSNVKSALLWLAHEKGIPEYGAPLSPPWAELRTKIKNAVARSRLSSFMRFCSANNVAPAIPVWCEWWPTPTTQILPRRRRPRNGSLVHRPVPSTESDYPDR